MLPFSLTPPCWQSSPDWVTVAMLREGLISESQLLSRAG
jgi:hypothetical protein